MNFIETKNKQKEILQETKKKIFYALKKDGRLSLPETTATGRGIGSPNCDMSMYLWIPVMTENKRVFWITLFKNYTDPETGNVHTEFGRISFVEPYSYNEKKPLNNASLNEILHKDETAADIRCFNNKWKSPLDYGDFKNYTPINGKALTVDDINSDGFNINDLIKAFFKYIEKEEK